MRRAARLILIALAAAVAAIAPTTAGASTPASPADRFGIAAASGTSESCLVADISSEDPTWAMAAVSRVAAGCVSTTTIKLVHRDAAGAWVAATSVNSLKTCPLPDVPLLVALDFTLCALDQESAVQAADELLTKKLGDQWSMSQRSWVRCPSAHITEDTDEVSATALCEFDLPRAQNVLAGSFRIVNIESGVQFAALKTRTFARKARTCAIASKTGQLANRVILTNRKMVAGGAFACPRIVATKSVSGLVDKLTAARYPKALPAALVINVPGVSTEGFEDRYRLACRVTHSGTDYTVACKNIIGDTVRYRFTVTQKPKPKPKPVAAPSTGSGSSGGSGCHPSYTGACLKQNAGDYDCEGGSGDGPNYTGPVSVVGPDEFDLDRDGDGSACE